ncbi:helix-turn-helix domain-containing protein [Neisseria lactamica]|uniref:helix-turn-helix domain-containing protein n=1 Tax=Neisseria lactamica TaxID=486 RepID=UPI0002F6DD0F|nr:helix-turn-helix domain-containing protein [Neisseria lactamica]
MEAIKKAVSILGSQQKMADSLGVSKQLCRKGFKLQKCRLKGLQTAFAYRGNRLFDILHLFTHLLD